MRNRFFYGHYIDALLLTDCIVRPRRWGQVPWRIVYFFNASLGKKMREKWRGKQGRKE
jgi:hypothetical protein